MKSAPLWNAVLVGFVWSIMILRKAQVVAEIDYSEVISIDCGVIQENVDENGFRHQADDAEFGELHELSPKCSFNNSNQEQNWQQMNTLRSFPQGKRNCYSLTPKQGKSKNHLVRAFFAADNCYDKSSAPNFDVYLGVNFWTSIEWDSSSDDQIQRKAVVQASATSNIDVCFIYNGHGIPFISLLELWPSPNNIYVADANNLPLGLVERNSLGLPQDHPYFIRYQDDDYGRAWLNKQVDNSEPFSISEAIDKDTSDYRLPQKVLNTAIRSRNGSFTLVIDLNYGADYDYYVYLHFFDFELPRSQNQLRRMDINITDKIHGTITLDQRKVKTFTRKIPKGTSINYISITSSPDSGLRPMINAYEIYRELPQSNHSTKEEDVDAMRKIKEAYKISRISWQGDPCMPPEYEWEGVTCNYSENIPRVTKLNLSSSKLKGEITAAFSNLTRLESLDLSNNQLTGEIPKSLAAELPNLKLHLDGNPDLCTRSCRTTKKSIIAITTSVAASVTVLLIIYVYLLLYKRRRNKESGKKMRQLKSKDRAFCRAEICSVTNNFEIVIGEGGFGRVYLGKLQDGTQVAIKLLSKSSQQGFKEFQSEAELLTIVHHRNLVSLIGYCDDGDMKALVYEYMTEGNLRYLLSDKSQYVLKWNERLQIAVNAACGLDYLHNGCKPAIIHRDLKTSNILLSENMQIKIADFGLSRAFATDSDICVSSQAAGTIGYLDPEFHFSGNLNKKSDVYSFGIILLELITGRPAIRGTHGNACHICDWITPKLENGDIQSIMDPSLKGKFNFESAWKFLEIAMSCVPPTAIQRPDISHVVNELKECLALELSLGNEQCDDGRILSTTFDISYPLESDLSKPYAR